MSEDNYLSQWSDIIRRQGEQRRQEEQAQLDDAIRRLPEKKAEMAALPSCCLLSHFRYYDQRRYTDPRLTAVMQELSQHCHDELLRRLEGSGPLIMDDFPVSPPSQASQPKEAADHPGTVGEEPYIAPENGHQPLERGAT